LDAAAVVKNSAGFGASEWVAAEDSSCSVRPAVSKSQA
jgi:hypothetical protein